MFAALVYPITVVEMPSCARDLDRLMEELDRVQLIDYLAFNPQAGDIMSDTGGIRKVRWKLSNRGKRGGARIIYYFRDLNMPLFMLAVYAKNEKITVSAADKRELRVLVDRLVEQHSGRLIREVSGDHNQDMVGSRRDDGMANGNKIVRGLREAVSFTEGNAKGARVTKVNVPDNIDVRALRERLGLSQTEFALRFGFSLGTLRHWEQGVGIQTDRRGYSLRLSTMRQRQWRAL